MEQSAKDNIFNIILIFFFLFCIANTINIFLSYPEMSDLIKVSPDVSESTKVCEKEGVICKVTFTMKDETSFSITKKHRNFADLLHAIDTNADYEIGFYKDLKFLFLNVGNTDNVYKITIKGNTVLSYEDSKQKIKVISIILSIAFLAIILRLLYSLKAKSSTPTNNEIEL